MIKKIYSEDELLAIIIPADYRSEGIQFFTENDYSQQLAYMNRKSGHVVKPHIHNEAKREVTNTLEVLLIKSGKVRVDLYNSQERYIESRILTEGYVILLASGGHGLEMIDDTEIIEVKQGPYTGDNDKTYISDIGKKGLKIIDD